MLVGVFFVLLNLIAILVLEVMFCIYVLPSFVSLVFLFFRRVFFIPIHQLGSKRKCQRVADCGITRKYNLLSLQHWRLMFWPDINSPESMPVSSSAWTRIGGSEVVFKNKPLRYSPAGQGKAECRLSASHCFALCRLCIMNS